MDYHFLYFLHRLYILYFKEDDINVSIKGYTNLTTKVTCLAIKACSLGICSAQIMPYSLNVTFVSSAIMK